jgi:outer membrane protein assembly factor BamB
VRVLTFLVWSIIIQTLAIHAASPDTASWPQFRGPNGSGVASDDKPAPVEFSRAKNLLWEAKLPPGHSSPCIFGDRIFLTAVGKQKKALETICIKRSNGKIAWRRPVEVEKFETVHKISNPATATPVCDGTNVYVYFGSYGLIAYDFDGREVWKKPLPMPILNAGGGSYGNGTSPIIAGDMLLFDLHIQAKSYLMTLRLRDGEKIWEAPEPRHNYGFSTPAVWKEGGESVAGVLNGGQFTVFNLKDGSERWWVGGLPLQTIGMPVVGENMVFLNGTGVLGASENVSIPPSFDEMLTQYDTNKDGLISVSELPGSLLYADRKTTTGSGNMSVHWYLRFFGGKDKSATMNREQWTEARAEMKQFAEGGAMKTAVCAVRLNGKGDVTKENIAWSQPKGVPEVPSSLYYRKRLYLVKSGGLATCLEAATGKILFQERLGVVGGFFASPVASGGRIYASSDAGKVVVFEAKDSLSVLGTNDLEEPIMATPAIVEGKLYVRSASRLCAFGN